MCEYPGRSHRRHEVDVIRKKNAVVTTNCEKSAEAIVPQKKMREGPNNRKSEETEEGGQYEESRIPWKRGLPAKG